MGWVMRRPPSRLLVLLLALLLLPACAVPASAGAAVHRPATAVAAQSQDQQAPEDGDLGDDPDGVYDDPDQQAQDEDVPPPAETPSPAPATPPVPDPFPAEPRAPLMPPLVTTGTVSGRQARLRTDGKAAIPRGAPLRVRAIIAAANRIIGKRYKWGGGHAKLADSGYDCSGTVSYALIRSGELASPLVSGSFAHWGSPGTGSYVTIYANKGHVYAEIAGLRLDTSAVGDPGGRDGVRWRPVIGKRRGFAVRHVPGL
jgi:cell wall-associated NlpC family hydrolase